MPQGLTASSHGDAIDRVSEGFICFSLRHFGSVSNFPNASTQFFSSARFYFFCFQQLRERWALWIQTQTGPGRSA